jgi:uncharacterized membrane protein
MSRHRIKSKPAGYSFRKNLQVFWPVMAILAVPLFLMAVVMVKTLWSEHPQTLAGGRDIRLDIATLRPNQLHLFETSVSGEKVRFVVERTEDNTIHVALAACAFCYRDRRSNRVQDGAVFCDRCRSTMGFASAKPGGHAKSCDLVEIPHQQTAQTLTVLARDIAQMAARPARK